MKIGTITFLRSNYGAILQAYALQVALKSLGHLPVLLDYREQSRQADSLFAPWTGAKNIALNLFTVFRYRFFIKRRKRFAEFRKRNLQISVKQYASSTDLKSSLPEYDAFICGSDQVWYPRSNYDALRAYHLGFVSREQALKISYAPSFGVASISSSYGQQIQPWIEDIPHLSVREKAGKVIIEQATSRKATITLDPTFLLEYEQWNRITTSPTISSPYILVYSTSQRGLFAELVNHIKKTTGLPVVVLSLYSLNLISEADRVIYDAGPSEFLGLFSNATCVCTNSFHGTAFSIIYRKPFWTVPHNNTNSRIIGLLDRIDLADRQVSSRMQLPQSPLEIDYTIAVPLLKQKKRQSMDFLKSALLTH